MVSYTRTSGLTPLTSINKKESEKRLAFRICFTGFVAVFSTSMTDCMDYICNIYALKGFFFIFQGYMLHIGKL